MTVTVSVALIILALYALGLFWKFVYYRKRYDSKELSSPALVGVILLFDGLRALATLVFLFLISGFLERLSFFGVLASIAGIVFGGSIVGGVMGMALSRAPGFGLLAKIKAQVNYR